MKKTLLISIFAGIILSFNSIGALAQSDIGNIIKINPLSLFVATGNIQFEHVTGPSSSWQLGAYYTGFSVSGTGFSGFGITPEYRFYLSSTSHAPKGFFIAPFLRYQNYSLTATDNFGVNDKATLSAFGGGAILGYQTIMGKRLSFEIFIGPDYSSATL